MKNTWMLLIFLVVGLLIGSLIGELLGQWIPVLETAKELVWQPRADLDIIQYDITLRIRMNLAGALGIIAAFWIYRKW